MTYNGLSTQRKAVLDVIQRLGKAAPNDIANSLDPKPGNIHEQLERLSRDDFIKRVSDKEYGLTERGKAVYEKRGKLKNELIKFSDEEVTEFKKFAKKEDFYERFGETFLPKLHGLDKEKLGCALSLVSLPDQDYDRNRIHVLLEGEPGSGKSSLIEGITTEFWGLFADSVRTSTTTIAGGGKGGVYKEGLMQIADMSMLAIDEIDKLDSKDQRALLGGMNRGKVTINLDQVLNKETDTRMRIIATCNRNNSLLPELRSRFDLKFTLKKLTLEQQKIMIKNMVENWNREKNIFNGDFMKRYLMYVNMFESKLPDDREWIYAYLVEENTFGALQKRDNRNKETILRLSLAIARMRLQAEVQKEHMKKAIELLGD